MNQLQESNTEGVIIYTPEIINDMVLRMLNANKTINGQFRLEGVFKESTTSRQNADFVIAQLMGDVPNSSIRLFFSSRYNGLDIYQKLVTGRRYVFTGSLSLYSLNGQVFLQMTPYKAETALTEDKLLLQDTEDEVLTVDMLSAMIHTKSEKKRDLNQLVYDAISNYRFVKLAVITAKSNTAEMDFLDGLKGTRSDFKIDLYTCNFTNPSEILKNIQEAESSDADIILLIRGGGGNLDKVDDNRLLQKMAEVEKPIITGLGHEVDKFNIELLADYRCSTPHGAGTYLNDLRNLAYQRMKADQKLKLLQQQVERNITYKKSGPQVSLFYGIKGTDNKYVKALLFILLIIGVVRIVSFFI